MKIEEVFARRRFIMLDGAMGTQLQLRGLTTEQKPELAAFIMPDVLTAVHRDYARAGADILLANTFGANPRKLKGTGDRSVHRMCPDRRAGNWCPGGTGYRPHRRAAGPGRYPAV